MEKKRMDIAPDPGTARHPLAPLAAFALLAACAGLPLVGCDWGVQDAAVEPPPRPLKDSILWSPNLWMLDTNGENKKVLEASTRPKAVIHWLDLEDTSWTGRYRGMVLDMDAHFPDSARLHFHHPKSFFGNPGPRQRRWQVGLLHLANDGDGDGRIFGWDRYGTGAGAGLSPTRDSVLRDYTLFNFAARQMRYCATDSCTRAQAAELEAQSDRFEAAGVGELGFRAAQRKELATDWYIASSATLLVVWIPDEVALGQASMGIDSHCADGPNSLEVGYNFKRLRRELPRAETWFKSDSAGNLLYWSSLEDYRDLGLQYECGSHWGGFRFSPRIFDVAPPLFQLGPDDIPAWN